MRPMLFAAPKKDAWVFAAELGRHNGHAKGIQDVAIHMSLAYIKRVNANLGNARVLHDKFRVIQSVV